MRAIDSLFNKRPLTYLLTYLRTLEVRQHRTHDHRLYGVVCDAQPACELSPIVVVISPLQVSREVFRCGLVTTNRAGAA